MSGFDTYLHLLPLAISWLLSIESNALSHGRPLTDSEMQAAYDVGVSAPDKIRLLFVDKLSTPDQPDLYRAGVEIGLLDESAVGRTVRYGIEIVHGHDTLRLLRHEFRHVHQFEVSDSFESFIYDYVKSIFDEGYRDSRYERDARAYES